ncbi:hypothetical protein HCX48_02665 [Rhodocyclus tenuis]|uniref:Uncharacterized protein n=1 Tax=Rhodocyclus gracilis TaxID=2929842 RepID=A0ABX0WEG9_9RHOO|nr:hypothetical protein [Rhodocyclus gracilis]MRD72598.1 hypothetical protein [Rhodocyclus gracilis]NJA88124.1 hypothetical protein [Rhodocyclus gracilis]
MTVTFLPPPPRRFAALHGACADWQPLVAAPLPALEAPLPADTPTPPLTAPPAASTLIAAAPIAEIDIPPLINAAPSTAKTRLDAPLVASAAPALGEATPRIVADALTPAFKTIDTRP